MKALQVDGGGEFILVKLCTFYEKHGIAIKYVAPYMHKEYGFVKQRWRTIITIKDVMLIDNGLSNDFWAETMETANYL